MKGKLSSKNLVNIVYNAFNRIPDPIKSRREIKLIDCLMSGYALFSLKYSSLLQFDNHSHEEEIKGSWLSQERQADIVIIAEAQRRIWEEMKDSTKYYDRTKDGE